MTDPDAPADPDRGDDPTDSAGSGRDGGDRSDRTPDGDRRERASDADGRATPRLANAAGGDADEEDRSVVNPGAPREPEPIEPEPLRAENALFVLLGVLGTVALLATAVVPGLL